MVMQVNNVQNTNGALSGNQNQIAPEMYSKPGEYIQPVKGQEATSDGTNTYLQEYLKDEIHFPDTRERVAVNVPAKNLEEARDLAQVISGNAVASVAAAVNKLRADRVAELLT